MTIASHVVEILRQGVWASLTGGWFYDPRQSTFCNTVHLYLWLILFVLPLITAICFNFASWTSIFIHCSIIGVLFSVLKTINWYLHGVFDTHEAIEQQETSSLDIRTTAAPTATTTGSTNSGVGVVGGGGHRESIIGGSNLGTRGERPTPENDARTTSLHFSNEGPSLFDSNSESFARMVQDELRFNSSYVKDLEDEYETEFTIKETTNCEKAFITSPSVKGKDFAVEADVHGMPHNESSSSGSDIPMKPLLSRKPEAKDEKTSSAYETQSNSRLHEVKSDSKIERPKKLRLEIEQTPRHDRDRDDDDDDDDDDDENLNETLSDDVFQRKYSEPVISFPENSFGRKKKRSKKGSGVRRTMSTVETRPEHRANSSNLLSEMSLDECRGKGVRKSYPGKTSSTDIFLLHARPPREAFETSNMSDDSSLVFASSSKNVQDTSFIIQPSDEGFKPRPKEETSPPPSFSHMKLRYDANDPQPSSTFYASPSGSLSARIARSANQQMRVARFLSADLPLTDIPERESESEKFDDFNLLKKDDLDGNINEHPTLASIGRSASGGETSNFSTLKSDVSSQRTMAASYCTASESPPARTIDDDVSSDAQKRRLIQSLRETLENLKSDSVNNFDAELKAFRDSSTPDLRLLFEESSADVDEKLPSTSSSTLPEMRPRLPSITVHQQQFRERLMEEIKRLLEEIIDSHPEALEAIESVRQAKMASVSRYNRDSEEAENPYASVIDEEQPGPSGAYLSQNDERRGRRHSRGRRSTSYAISKLPPSRLSPSPRSGQLPIEPNAALAELVTRPGTHAATCHDDTTEGAVHCFQDEDGNWFTYTFSTETGVGPTTAQSIGTERNVVDMLCSQTSVHAPSSLRWPSSSDRSVTFRRQRHPASVSSGHRSTHRRSESDGRASNSSSEESFFTEVPTSVLHPSVHAVRNTVVETSSHVPTFINFGNLRSSSGSYSTTSRRRPRPQLHLSSIIGRTLGNAGTTTAAAITGASSLGGGGSNAGGVPSTTPGDYSTINLSGGGSQYQGVSASNIRSASMGSGSSLNRIRFLTGLAGLAAGRRTEERPKRKQFYRVNLCPFITPKSSKIRLDRLRLMALFDQNRTRIGLMVDIVLAISVSLTTCMLLKTKLFYDLTLIALCAVAAGAQFSLLKSVQPDAASPIHGYNWLVSYSRPVYYCLLGILIIVFDIFKSPDSPEPNHMTIYGVDLTIGDGLLIAKNVLTTIILVLPVFFTLGLLPQLNTFVTHTLEQIDMLIFGGTATFGLISALYSLTRSVVCASFLFALCQFGLQQTDGVQSVVYSAFCGILLAVSYALSRTSSNPRLIWNLLMTASPSSWCRTTTSGGGGIDANGHQQHSSTSLSSDVNANTIVLNNADMQILILRLKSDCLVSFLLAVLAFALHCSTVFTKLQPGLFYTVPWVTVAFGFLAHYVWPQFRKHTPFLLIAQPILRSHEHGIFDVDRQATLMWFERVYACVSFLERNLLYPIVVFNCLTYNAALLTTRFGVYPTSALITIASMKLLRTSYCNVGELYVPLAGAMLLFLFDFVRLSQTLLLDFYVLAIFYPKAKELILKYQFIFAYVAPWQISWGSAFHAFAQPCAVPHSALTIAVGVFSSLISAPLNPFLGSAVFLMSYVRPVKFWEKDYNTKRVDHSNTRLATQLDRAPTTDDSNLNAIFYEHLTRSLQTSLAGDLLLGRWANSVCAGDCFVLASFYLNCLVHVIEIGNGFVTFQLRGLEFRGTYCQQREVEAISEEIADGEGCCCYEPGHLPGFLSFNTAWSLRWLAWEVTAAKFVLEGYSVTDNSAVGLLQVIELRKLLVTLYVKCILYYAVRSPKLDDWLSTETIVGALESIVKDERYVDMDPSFSESNDEDYDFRMNGISRQAFCTHYLQWIEYCVRRRQGASTVFSCAKDSLLTAFCYGLSLVGRRVLGAAAQGRHTSGAESFLYGLHALFKGDFRITCPRDEWVFADMDLLRCVVAPSVRMALKLHQDHFTAPDDYDDLGYLYRSISCYEKNLFISHESDPAWRQAILANTPSLLALRHVFEDGQDDFKIIMLNKRHMNFRVIKLNKECVRAFWAGQQQELIFLRNRNPERGSIQNARQVLRNMINSSADQPIGYPIYVSPLTTSFVESHGQISSVTGPSLTLDLLAKGVRSLFRRLIDNCGTSGSSNIFPTAFTAREPSASIELYNRDRGVAVPIASPQERQPRPSSSTLPAQRQSSLPPMIQRSFTHPLRAGQFLYRGTASGPSTMEPRRTPPTPVAVGPFTPRNSVVSSSGGKGVAPRVSLGSLLAGAESAQSLKGSPPTARRQIKDISLVYDSLDKPLGVSGQTVVVWPEEDWRRRGGRIGWKEWRPDKGLEGSVVHRWTPSNPDHTKRSHMDKVILLLRVLDGKYYVPVAEAGVVNVGDEI